MGKVLAKGVDVEAEDLPGSLPGMILPALHQVRGRSRTGALSSEDDKPGALRANLLDVRIRTSCNNGRIGNERFIDTIRRVAGGLPKARALSQAEAARRIDVADAQVSRRRRSQVVPSVKHVRQIAAAFGVAPATIEHLIAPDVASRGARTDPVQQAEMDTAAAQLATVLHERVPSTLWPAYVRACEALADEMVTAFHHTRNAAPIEQDHPIGFHLRDDQ